MSEPMNHEPPDIDLPEDQYIDPDAVPDVDVGVPQTRTVSKAKVLGWACAILAVGGGAYVARAAWQPDASSNERTTLKKVKQVHGSMPESLRDVPTADDSRVPDPGPIHIAASKAEADQEAKAAGFEPLPDDKPKPYNCADDPTLHTYEEVIACEKRFGGESDAKPAGSGSFGNSTRGYAANTGKQQPRDEEDETEIEADMPHGLEARRKSHGSAQREELSPPPAAAGLSGLQGLGNALAAAQGQQTALQALAASQGDDDDKREAFMGRDGIGDVEGTEAIGRCSVRAGTAIRGNVMVATNSDLPSGNTVTIEVSETVYCGGDHQFVALPQGSRFVGEVNSKVGYGSERQQLCMKQLDRPKSLGYPHGDTTSLGCMTVADIQGAAGMPADVDNHWGQVIGGSILSAILSLGTSASAGNQTGFAATTAQNAAHAAGNNINQAGNRIVQRELQRKPTLTTKILEGVTVMFTRNVNLEPWQRRPLKKPRTHRITWVNGQMR